MRSIQFSIRMDPDIKFRLDREAKLEDRSAAYIAQTAIDEFLQRKEHLRSIVRSAEREAANGELISGEAMHAWVASWGGANELPEPEPDISAPRPFAK